MDTLLKALDSLQIILANPALSGGSSIRTSEASEILRLIITLAQDPTTDAMPAMEMLTDTLTAMAALGRGPTPFEWINIRRCQAEYDVPPEEDTQAMEDAPEPELEPEKKKSVFKRAASKKATKSKK